MAALAMDPPTTLPARIMSRSHPDSSTTTHPTISNPFTKFGDRLIDSPPDHPRERVRTEFENGLPAEIPPPCKRCAVAGVLIRDDILFLSIVSD